VVAAARRQGVYGKATWRTKGVANPTPPSSFNSATLGVPTPLQTAGATAGSSAIAPHPGAEWEGASGGEAGFGLGLGLGVGVGVEVEVEGGVDVHLMSVGAALAMLHCWLLGLQAQVLQGRRCQPPSSKLPILSTLTL